MVVLVCSCDHRGWQWLLRYNSATVIVVLVVAVVVSGRCSGSRWLLWLVVVVVVCSCDHRGWQWLLRYNSATVITVLAAFCGGCFS